MSRFSTSDKRAVLGIVAHHLLRVRSIVEMRQEAPLAIFAPPDSPLLEVADVPCPVKSLDMSVEEFDVAVESVIRRGITLGGILAIRDGNVYAAAAACQARGIPSAPVRTLTHVRVKSAFRKWLDENATALGCRAIPWRLIPEDMSYLEFCDEMQSLCDEIRDSVHTARPAIILKPDAGSCSQLIGRIDSVAAAELERAWRIVQRGRTFRNRRFLAECAVDGREIAVDTVSAGNLKETFFTGYLPRDPGTFYTAGAVVPAYPALTSGEEAALRQIAVGVHSALELSPAVTHMELIIPEDGGRPVIVELNPRLGGGMLQEMHRLVSGVQLYRIAARFALGKTDVADLLGNDADEQSTAEQVLIRFRRPGIGRMAVGEGAPELVHAFERFRYLQPIGKRLKGGTSDDDLLAWCLLGALRGEFPTKEEAYRSLIDRAKSLMFGWLPDVQ